jgi:Fe-S-cluster containining protein
MPSTDPLAALKALQHKASAFFEDFAQRHAHDMACRKGCTACCHVDLSLFRAEAHCVLAWVQELNAQEQQQLYTLLFERQQEDEAGLTLKKPNPVGAKHEPCAFLVQDACSIYAARPTVCRTQGAPLLWRSEDPNAPNTRHLDVCPVHPGAKRAEWPDPAEALDLDRLNTLLVLTQKDFEATGQRISLNDLRNVILDQLRT